MERNTSSHDTMSRIDFGLLGMPTRIQFTNGSVTEYIYAAREDVFSLASKRCQTNKSKME
ncbi:MAG: hypothetical protein KBT33_07720 [Prevotellaceae bacterium]|nr:hypothetical protein [Candidatus Minthosoma equi]